MLRFRAMLYDRESEEIICKSSVWGKFSPATDTELTSDIEFLITRRSNSQVVTVTLTGTGEVLSQVFSEYDLDPGDTFHLKLRTRITIDSPYVFAQ